mmetsp:Transcript_50350/g.102581  ORF Transcript_50350/g.102581 Transcript_50350/m.102581 type:complete len:223 (+) Transcript_50350:155-823(+)
MSSGCLLHIILRLQHLRLQDHQHCRIATLLAAFGLLESTLVVRFGLPASTLDLLLCSFRSVLAAFAASFGTGSRPWTVGVVTAIATSVVTLLLVLGICTTSAFLPLLCRLHCLPPLNPALISHALNFWTFANAKLFERRGCCPVPPSDNVAVTVLLGKSTCSEETTPTWDAFAPVHVRSVVHVELHPAVGPFLDRFLPSWATETHAQTFSENFGRRHNILRI